MFFFAVETWSLVARAIIFHKKYCSDLVYIAKPQFRVTNWSHKLLLVRLTFFITS